MTVKQEYEHMKTELRTWNERTNWDDTSYCYHIEHYSKKSKKMFFKLLNADFDMMNTDMELGIITVDEYNKLWKVWNDCSRSIGKMVII